MAAFSSEHSLKDTTSGGEKQATVPRFPARGKPGVVFTSANFLHDLKWQLSLAAGGKMLVQGGKPGWRGLFFSTATGSFGTHQNVAQVQAQCLLLRVVSDNSHA